MKKILLSCLVFLAACSTPLPETKDHFPEMKGCFLLYNLKTQKLDKVIGGARCEEMLPACSTFKIPLAVIAFDSGVLKDENQVLKWDGKKQFLEAWNKDHNAKTWMKESVVWFSQRLTPKLGEEKFQKYLKDFDYGNQDLEGGLTEAWLVSPSSNGPALKISGYGQLEFMKKLWTNSLPVSQRSMTLTQEISYLETSPKGYKLSGKTGSNFYDEQRRVQLGWFISHISKRDESYITVTNLSDIKPSDTKYFGGYRAREITKNILKDLGLW